MKVIAVTVKGINIEIRSKGNARVWEFERKENWKEQVINYCFEEKIRAKIELYLGEEYFKINRVKLEPGETLRERIEEEQQENLEKKIWRWIEIDKYNRNYLLISMPEREIEELKRAFLEIGQEVTLITPDFLKEKNINFIKRKNKRIILILLIFILEVIGFLYLSYQENKENKKLTEIKGKSFELKKQLNELEKRENKESLENIEIISDAGIKNLDIVIEVLETLPINIYLELWSLENNILKLQGIGNQEKIYELEKQLLKKRNIRWIEIGYIKKSKKGYEFLIEIYF